MTFTAATFLAEQSADGRREVRLRMWNRAPPRWTVTVLWPSDEDPVGESDESDVPDGETKPFRARTRDRAAV